MWHVLVFIYIYVGLWNMYYGIYISIFLCKSIHNKVYTYIYGGFHKWGYPKKWFTMENPKQNG